MNPPGGRLPFEVDSFVGRSREVDEIKHSLSTSRLLTLTGPGGCGKTRLALRVARELEPSYPDGVRVVEFAAISDSALVARAVANAVGVKGSAGTTLLPTLVGALSTRRLLLVLDNCEHLIGECAQLVETLLVATPHLKILATSREALRVAGERSWRVPPLPAPPASVSSARLESFATSPAVALFVDRARGRQPGFTLTADNAEAIARICVRVEGLPLAIELAAGQMAMFTPAQFAERADDALRLLSGGGRTRGRHETLRATLDWSYDLLTQEQQHVLARLAVFAGGFDIEAAEVICGRDGVAASAVLSALTELVTKSLVEPVPTFPEPRYRMLEPIRQYARERLEASGEYGACQRLHAELYAARAEAAEPALRSAHRRGWMDRLAADQDNIRAALSWSRRPGDANAEVGLRISAALLWYWALRGESSEGFEWAEGALARAPGADPRLTARALYCCCELAWQMGETRLARERAEEATSIFRALDEPLLLAYALQSLPMTNGHPRATANQDESMRLFSNVDDEWGAALAAGAVDMLALFSAPGADEEFERRLEHSLALWRAVGDGWGAAQMLNILGDVARTREDNDLAARRYQESLDLLRKEGLGGSVGSLLQNLGYVALRRGETRRALALLRDGLATFRDQGDQRGMADCFDGIAGALCAMKHAAQGVRLLAASDRLRASIQADVWPANRTDYDRIVATARAELDDAAFAAAWSEGQESTLEKVVRMALEGGGAGGEGGPNANDLTPREREVAALVAGGSTNREIGAALVITEGTARLHVKHVLGKLGFRSRAQIAAWAVEHGLAGEPGKHAERHGSRVKYPPAAAQLSPTGDSAVSATRHPRGTGNATRPE